MSEHLTSDNFKKLVIALCSKGLTLVLEQDLPSLRSKFWIKMQKPQTNFFSYAERGPSPPTSQRHAALPLRE